MKSLKRRIACSIASQLVPERRIEAEDFRRTADGSVPVTRTFHSPENK
jgi:hypothetical protein